jgi:hypothetical protein
VVDLEESLEHVGVIVLGLHPGNGELLFVGQTLDAAHHRLKRGLRRLVGAGLGPGAGLGEHLDDLVQVPPVRVLCQSGVQRARHLDRPTVQRLHQGGKPRGHQVRQLFVTDSRTAFEHGDPPAQTCGHSPLAHQHHRDG